MSVSVHPQRLRELAHATLTHARQVRQFFCSALDYIGGLSARERERSLRRLQEESGSLLTQLEDLLGLIGLLRDRHAFPIEQMEAEIDRIRTVLNHADRSRACLN